MNLLTPLSELFAVFLFCFVFIFIARKLAKRIGLTDEPNRRKQHEGKIPLVGGLSVLVGVVLANLLSPYSQADLYPYLTCASVLVIVGALDDRFDISVKIRALVQAIAAIIMMCIAKLHLVTFGFIFGSVELQLGPFGYPLTLLAVWVAINAFNMIDGIDGLLGLLSFISFASLGFLFYLNAEANMAYWCFANIAATLPYLFFNLGLIGKRFKIFMGDAGSTLIGFTLIWFLMEATQRPSRLIHPVTALWLIAVPLMDSVAIMYRRLRQGQSPFTADRQHIHHIFMRAGFSSRQALLLITSIALIFAAIGVGSELVGTIPEWVMMLLFLFAFASYAYCLGHTWRLARYLRRSRKNFQQLS